MIRIFYDFSSALFCLGGLHWEKGAFLVFGFSEKTLTGFFSGRLCIESAPRGHRVRGKQLSGGELICQTKRFYSKNSSMLLS